MKSAKLKERETLLREWQKMLLRFKTEIGYAARPLGELILSCPEYSVCALAAKQADFSINPIYAMQNAGDEIFRHNADRKLHHDFAAGLGTTHTEGQLEHIALYADLVQAHLREASAEIESKSRLYVALGGFTAVTICMLII